MASQVNRASARIGAKRLLALLFGRLPVDKDYTTKSGEWSEALLQLRDRHEEYEDLFEGLTFSRRPGRRPYSREVSKFLLRLQAGTVVQVINPGVTRLRIRSEVQKELYEHHARRVDEDTLSIVDQLATELAKNSILAVPSAS
ncbi:MAG: hypothetical protein COX90_00175 [Candidatus Nealsonbacteria bacterium CG_4_10_14_0_2_um_filter_38_17]|uniref:Uncharacterized protein n=2 Tax=Candidatus Nealsoniibacteriota TaxID=1817911 RepID=A0A2M7UZ90_9BACT|nr:MAG: hypothetical protein COX36_00505 [Candidatus Nealsonbacteria bacterium CG23_combo_of_CG06-09_8_20_14_all_38_19]PIZ89276.1 MAG: hypothetical protein COX90_00175 [Candidatus Nealsonbacteria bacterium CG_4_10_14_0_2_um_filter_38_17]PJB54151.1 MAG: hypothetical protein CO099_03165 [Bdellovibrio sp. CG_4_9_14_3_um_filter_39_7]